MEQAGNYLIADINNVKVSDLIGIWEGPDVFGNQHDESVVCRYYLLTNRIFVYKVGKLVEEGSWELMERSGYTDKLFSVVLNGSLRVKIISIAPRRMVISAGLREYELVRSQ